MDQSSRSRGIRICLIVALPAALFGLVCLVLWFFIPVPFQGDGALLDRGFPSYYPRYCVEYPAIPLDKPGTYHFNSRGFPYTALTFQLRVPEGHKYETLGTLHTKVVVQITDSRGNQVAEASGALNQWVLQWTPADAVGAYWQPSCRELEMDPGQEYSIDIIVSEVDPATPPLLVRPIFEGGGIEFP